VIVNCNDLWTRLVNVARRLRGRPIVTNVVPPVADRARPAERA
jgi:hypothetical protein